MFLVIVQSLSPKDHYFILYQQLSPLLLLLPTIHHSALAGVQEYNSSSALMLVIPIGYLNYS